MTLPPLDWHSLGIDVRGRTSGQTKTVCPKCSHTRRNKAEPCLSVNLDANTFHCFHCGWAGPEKGYAKERGMAGDAGVGTRLRPEEREKPKSYRKPEPPPRAPEQDRMIEFFTARGIRAETVHAYGIYQGSYTTKDGKTIQSICFPYHVHDELVNIKHRFPNKRFAMESGAELTFYNLDRVQGAETVIVVEGEMDVLAMAEAGYTTVISPPNGAPSINTDIENASLDYLKSGEKVFAQARRVILAGDMDEPGRRYMDELARRVGKGKCWRVTWPDGCKDANDVLMSDGFEGGVSGIRAALDMAEPYPVDGITQPGDYEDDLWKYENDTEHGARISTWPNFANLCRFSPGQLTILTGTPGSGKSVWLNSVLLDLANKHGWHIGLFSPEYHPPDMHVRDLIENMLGKTMNQTYARKFNLPVATREEVRVALADLNKRISFIIPPEPTLDAIIERAQTLVFREGIKMLIVDPWTEIDQSQRGNMAMTDWVDMCLKRLRRFGREFDVHVVIVAHPKKMAPVTDRSGARNNPVVTPYDISDSRHWAEMADVILSIWRDRSDPEEPVQVHIQKIRFRDNGQLGLVLFRYDRHTRRYQDITDQVAEGDYDFVA